MTTKKLKNYTTTISVEKTVMEIERILSKYGATNIFKMYEDGVVKGLAFQTTVNERPLSFKLPLEEENIQQVFNQAVSRRELPEKYRNNIEQSRRTGWRIIKDWIDAQMSLIQINTVKFEQVFLPYLYDMRTNQTLFEKMEKTSFSLQIEDKQKRQE